MKKPKQKRRRTKPESPAIAAPPAAPDAPQAAVAEDPAALVAWAQHAIAAGRLPAAEAALDRALAATPDDPAALHYRGLVAYRMGQVDDAIRMMQRSVELTPDSATYPCNLSVLLSNAGRHAEAVAAAERAIRIKPDLGEAHRNRANALLRLGRLEVAVPAFRAAIALRPDDMALRNDLGVALQQLGRLDEAIAVLREGLARVPDHVELLTNLCTVLVEAKVPLEAVEAGERAIAARPDHPGALYNLGNAYRAMLRMPEAVAVYRRAIAVRPLHAPSHNNLGIALKTLRQFEEAETAYRGALAVRPDFPSALTNLGIVLARQGRFDEALAHARRAMELTPADGAFATNCGQILYASGDPEAAIAMQDRAIAIAPELADAHMNRAVALLSLGRYREGWEEYHWRWRTTGFDYRSRHAALPEWQGAPAPGKRLLVHIEQGQGDLIQFVRLMPLLKRRTGAVIHVEAPGSLAALFETAPGIDGVQPTGGTADGFDLRISMMSLPGLLGIDLTQPPMPVPYLRADPARIAAWRERLGAEDGRLRVGLVWAGRPEHADDHNRTIAERRLMPLFDTPGVRFISLQVGPRASNIRRLKFDDRVEDWSRPLTDFAETAAAMTQLDLMISVDTAPAHLAGALGMPVWMLLPFAPDFRWRWGRSDVPWYPTMRLWRQPGFDQWEAVVAEVSGALRALVEAPRGARWSAP